MKSPALGWRCLLTIVLLAILMMMKPGSPVIAQNEQKVDADRNLVIDISDAFVDLHDWVYRPD
jgi:hypothetical protein